MRADETVCYTIFPDFQIIIGKMDALPRHMEDIPPSRSRMATQAAPYG